MSQAFLPLLTCSQGAIVNNASMMAFAPLPLTPAYAVSKAAAFNMTQSLRALLAPLGVRVHAVLTGPTDTDMTRGFEIPKATPSPSPEPSSTASTTDDEDIFPDPLSKCWPTAGTTVPPRRSSSSTRRSRTQRRLRRRRLT